METLVLAGGCFWGLQELLRAQPGVVNTVVGYTGGINERPTYVHHPKHAEAVLIEFDESVTDVKTLLDYFFRIHNPTTLNQQGNDIGDSYRSAIFYSSETQRDAATEVMDKVSASGNWKSDLVTALEPLNAFWPAEDEHQDYLQKNKGGYTCHYERDLPSVLS